MIVLLEMRLAREMLALTFSQTCPDHFGILSLTITSYVMSATLDISTVQAFLLIAELRSFTRAAEAAPRRPRSA